MSLGYILKYKKLQKNVIFDRFDLEMTLTWPQDCTPITGNPNPCKPLRLYAIIFNSPAIIYIDVWFIRCDITTKTAYLRPIYSLFNAKMA